MLDLVDILVLNESELGSLARVELRATDVDGCFVAAMQSLQDYRSGVICVTLGKRGAIALVNGKPLVIPARTVKALDTTGAGDCFVGAVAAQLASGKSICDAFQTANIAASICVQRMGAAPSMPTAAEVDAGR